MVPHETIPWRGTIEPDKLRDAAGTSATDDLVQHGFLYPAP